MVKKIADTTNAVAIAKNVPDYAPGRLPPRQLFWCLTQILLQKEESRWLFRFETEHPPLAEHRDNTKADIVRTFVQKGEVARPLSKAQPTKWAWGIWCKHGGQSLWRRQARVKYFNLESRAYGESFFLHDENSLTLVALTGATEAKDDET
jgi:hypothetical protein